MKREPSGDITNLLHAWSDGDDEAFGRLAEVVYERLRRIAAHALRYESAGHILQTTGLIHEAFLGLMRQRNHKYENREDFFKTAALIIRRFLLDEYRRRKSQKAGGHIQFVEEEAAGDVPDDTDALDYEDLYEALEALRKVNPQWADVVDLKIIIGLTLEEIAEVTGVGIATVTRRWRAARAWLRKWLDES